MKNAILTFDEFNEIDITLTGSRTDLDVAVSIINSMQDLYNLVEPSKEDAGNMAFHIHDIANLVMEIKQLIVNAEKKIKTAGDKLNDSVNDEIVAVLGEKTEEVK